MAAGTSDARVVPPARRQAISQSANPLVHGGVVAGTWKARGERLDVGWFSECPRAGAAALDHAVAALAHVLGRPLELTVEAA